jgi:hypothetical protein
MPSMPHVVILIARDASFVKWKYFLDEIAKVWIERDVRVSVQRGPGAFIEADLAISHVDLTVVPPDHTAFLARYRKVINGPVSDISKRRISRQILERGDPYDGPVIVKTDWNSGGWRERERFGGRSQLRRLIDQIRGQLPWGYRASISTNDYPVLPSIEHVPWIVWKNRDLVVERFLCERQDDLYCLRTWMFLGDQETNSLSLSHQSVVKLSSVVRREAVPLVPPELREMRRQLGFDFGKFDYAIVDGRAVLYDANRTPTLGAMPPEQFLPRIRLLARGLNAFLPPEMAVAWE